MARAVHACLRPVAEHAIRTMPVRKARNAAIVGFVTKLTRRTRISCTAADAAVAPIDRRTKLPVVAGITVVDVATPRRRIAGVIRADVAVVAVGRRTAHAQARRAGVVDGAGVPIVARRGVVDMDASDGRIATIRRTCISVAAQKKSTGATQ